jgi:APA family basic amino acid/polyamine antiporter
MRRLGLFDVTMLVMGGVIGSGIFINPYVVAQRLDSPALILAAWIAGGLLVIAGALTYAELARGVPGAGGQYAYLREAFPPVVSFLYGWALLLVIIAGAMAAVAITFARYFLDITGWGLPDWTVAACAIALLVAVNCFGVRAGSNVQSALMLLKIAAIGLLVAAGALLAPRAPEAPAAMLRSGPADFLAALVPVLFAYGGWQTATFVSGEMKNPERDLPRGILAGVAGVVVLYLAVNFVCLRVLGAEVLAQTSTPATAVMRSALGENSARWIALGIAVSTLGFLSQAILVTPRVYATMARDGVLFDRFGWLHPDNYAPVYAILLQGGLALVVVLSGRYEQILNYVVSMDFLFYGLTGIALLVLRKRWGQGFSPLAGLFAAACLSVVAATVWRFPSALVGYGVLAAGVPAFRWWRARR